MNTKLIKNTSLYTLGNILPKIVGFILIPIYTRFLTPADYGIINSMSVFGSILIIIFSLSIDRSISRFYFDFKTEKERKDYFGTIFISLFLISTSALLLTLIFNKYIGLIYKSIPFSPFYFIVIFTIYLEVFFNITYRYFRSSEKASIFIGLSLLTFFLKAVFTITLVVLLKKGALGSLKANLYAAIILFPLFSYLNIKIMNFKFNRRMLIDSLKFSLPMLPSTLSAWTLNLSDRIFIERYFTLTDVGIYSLGYQFASYIMIFTEAFNKAYEPTFYSLANSDNPVDEIKQKLGAYNYAYISIILFLCFLLSLFSKEVIFFLLDSRYHEAYKITMLISLAYFINCITHPIGLSIQQDKKTYLTMYSIVISAVFNIILNFILIPILGMYGAAISTILSFSARFIVLFLFSKKCYYIPLKWIKIAKHFIILASISVSLYFISIGTDPIYSFFAKMMITIVLSFTIYKQESIQILKRIRGY